MIFVWLCLLCTLSCSAHDDKANTTAVITPYAMVATVSPEDREQDQNCHKKQQEEQQVAAGLHYAAQHALHQNLAEQHYQHALRMVQQYKNQQKLVQEYQQTAELYQAQIYSSQKNYADEEPRLAKAYAQWRESAPKRARAYEQTKQQGGRAFGVEYTLSDSAKKVLSQRNINVHNYDGCFGNALQQQLISEIVTNINTAAQLPAPCHTHAPFRRSIYDDTFHLLDTAREVNEMGCCTDAADLIDLSTTLIQYLAAIGGGIKDGAIAAVKDTVHDTIELVRHPVAAVQHLRNAAIMLGKILYQYWPASLPEGDGIEITAEDIERYERHNEAVSKRWRDTAHAVRKYWNNTSTCTLAYQAAYCVAHAGTNVLAVNRCISLLGTLGRAATPYVKKVGKIGKAKLAGTVPGYLLLESEGAARLFTYGLENGLQKNTLTKMLYNLERPEVQGSLTTLSQAVVQLKGTPGLTEAVKTVLENCLEQNTFYTAKGAYYEIYCALHLQKQGEKVMTPPSTTVA